MNAICRQRRLWLLTLSGLPLALGACLATHIVTPDERLVHNSTDGYFVFAVDGPPPTTVAINMCQDGSVEHCFTAGPLRAQGDVMVMAVPAARYCLQQILVETGATTMDMQLARKRMQCFTIDVAAATYAGHLTIEIAPTQFSTNRVRFGWKPHSDMRGVLDARYPQLAALELLTPMLTPAGPDPLMRGVGSRDDP